MSQLGLEFGPDRSQEIEGLKEELANFEIKKRNSGYSLHLNHISPACTYCNRADGSTTFIISLACNRNCFFCTNRNQHNYDLLRRTVNDVRAHYDRVVANWPVVQSVALTGGEPLLFPEKCREFFSHVKSTYPAVHTRLYTNGDLASDEVLGMVSPWLDEIRIGVKPDSCGMFSEKMIEAVLARCKRHIPQVTVELPVLPGKFFRMASLLELCNDVGIFSVNLLEFLFPWQHAEMYREQGHRIRYRPYRVMYNYDYAGGLPVDGSEPEALRCLLYAAYQEMDIGVHYCSLENKLTSQIYQQNSSVRPASTELVSQRDHFLKSVRFLGADVRKAYSVLKEKGVERLIWDNEYRILECHPKDLIHLRDSDIDEAVLTYAVAERTEDHVIIREVDIERIDPRTFNPRAL